MGGLKNIISDPTLPLHPSLHWIEREMCNPNSIQTTVSNLASLEMEIDIVESDIKELNVQIKAEQELFCGLVETLPTDNRKDLIRRYTSYRKCKNKIRLISKDIKKQTNFLKRSKSKLYRLEQSLQGQKVGFQYARKHRNQEFVVYLNHNSPVIQKTQRKTII